MAKYVCPICDQPMTNKHFCTKCGSFVKEPYIREATYFLNERHPEHEKECSYHLEDKVVNRQQPLEHINMAEFGRSSLHGAAELLKEYHETSRQRSGASTSVKEPSETQETKKLPTLVLVIFFIIFLNIFSSVIVPFLRYIMSLLS